MARGNALKYDIVCIQENATPLINKHHLHQSLFVTESGSELVPKRDRIRVSPEDGSRVGFQEGWYPASHPGVRGQAL